MSEQVKSQEEFLANFNWHNFEEGIDAVDEKNSAMPFILGAEIHSFIKLFIFNDEISNYANTVLNFIKINLKNKIF